MPARYYLYSFQDIPAGQSIFQRIFQHILEYMKGDSPLEGLWSAPKSHKIAQNRGKIAQKNRMQCRRKNRPQPDSNQRQPRQKNKSRRNRQLSSRGACLYVRLEVYGTSTMSRVKSPAKKYRPPTTAGKNLPQNSSAAVAAVRSLFGMLILGGIIIKNCTCTMVLLVSFRCAACNENLSCRSNVNVQNVEGVNAFSERSERALKKQ